MLVKKFALVTLVAACLVNVAQANLISNGGFESPDASGVGFRYEPPYALDDWSGTGYYGNALTGTDGTTAPEGDQYGLVEIFSSISSSLSQTVTFPTSGNYILSYVDADRTGIYGDLNYDIRLTQGGTTNITTGLNAVSTLTFGERSFTFFANAGAGTITFFADGSSGDNRSVYLDAINLVAVSIPAPEPNSLLLCGLGALGMSFARRRCRAGVNHRS